jgi:hypothetical protein
MGWRAVGDGELGNAYILVGPPEGYRPFSGLSADWRIILKWTLTHRLRGLRKVCKYLTAFNCNIFS